MPWPTIGRTVVSSGIGITLAAVLLFYSMRGINWREAGHIAMSARPGLLIATLGLATVTLWLRAVRWRVLLKTEGDVPLRTVFWATAAGYLANNVLPARAGEVGRSVMISTQSTLSAPFVIATALCERIADAIVLIAVLGVVLVVLPQQPEWAARAAIPLVLVAMVSAIAVVLLPGREVNVRALVQWSPIPDRWRERLRAGVDQSLRGIRTFHDARRLWTFALLTAMIWILDAFGAVVGAWALGFALPLTGAFLLLASLGLSSALPSTPGYVGIFQFVAITVLAPFGFSRTDALTYIVITQATHYAVIGICGALGLSRYRRSSV